MSTCDVYLLTELNQAQKEFGKDQVKQFLGIKGTNLSELSNIEGVPVPKGFTISSRACNDFLTAASDPPALPDPLWDSIVSSIKKLEEETEKKFGDGEKPLIFSCRPSPSVSMPQILQTFYNVGYNDKAVTAIGAAIENPVFSHSIYRRYLQDYGMIVMKINQEKFDEVTQTFNSSATEPEELEKYETQLKELIEQETGDPFPQDPLDQLKKIIITIFESWNSDQAQEFREQNKIPYELGTAVVVQSQVYGNLNESSGAGVVFTRNPSNGESTPTGNFLQQSVGLDLLDKEKSPQPYASLEQASQGAYEKFSEVIKKIESFYKNIQKIDFTVENNELWILQTRESQCNTHASFKILVDMVNDGIMSKEESIEKLKLFDIEGCCPEDEDEKPEEDEENKENDANAENQNQPEGPEKLKLDEEQELQQLLTWSDEIRQTDGLRTINEESKGFPIRGLGIRSNYKMKISEPTENGGENPTDNPEISASKNLGADGFCINTEEIFLSEPRIELIRKLILSENEDEIKAATKDLVEQQSNDYSQLFEGLNGSPCVIRLPDLSVTDFLPDIFDLATEIERIKARIEYGIAVEEEERHEPTEEETKNEENKDNENENNDNENQNENEEGENADNENNENQEEKKEEKPEVQKPPKPKPIEIKQKLFEKVQLLTEENTKLGIRGARLLLLFPSLLQAVLKALIEGATNAQGKGQQVSPDILLPFVTSHEEFHQFKNAFNQSLKDFAQEKEAECPVTFRLGCEISVVNCAIEIAKLANLGSAFFLIDEIGLTSSVYGYGMIECNDTFAEAYIKNSVFREVTSSKNKDGNPSCDSPFLAFDTECVAKLITSIVAKAREAKSEVEIGITTNDKDHELDSFNCYHKVGLNYVSCRHSRLPIARVVSAKFVANDKLTRDRQSGSENEMTSQPGNNDGENKVEGGNNDQNDTTTTETESTYDE